MNKIKNTLIGLRNAFNRADNPEPGVADARLANPDSFNDKTGTASASEKKADSPRPDWYESTHGPKN